MHNVTDGQTDRQTDDILMPRADHTACNTIGYKALSTLETIQSLISATVTENGDCRRFRRQIVAEIGDYSLQCGQAIRLPLTQCRHDTV